ncbi:MAG TPA: hypothetical protein VMR17_14970 [Xanthobacteraceae bacterium]|nr:hypothetical protein [Xanthobacteraceae bacterium]
MRCILVNDAYLKTEASCAYCRKKIGDSYAREIDSRFLYCDYDCYRGASQVLILSPAESARPANHGHSAHDHAM